jgi:prolyl oligopeptidase
MPKLMEPPPYSPVEAVSETLHGVTVTDPYRWLEDQNSPATRRWLEAQTLYTRAYLESIPERERIRERLRELLDVETYESIQRVGQRYFFRKRLPGQEQPCIFMREGPDGEDYLLIDPVERGTGEHTAVKPLRISPDGRVLLYEVKQGGERSGTFELLEIESRKRLSDILPRGYLRGFAFAPDSRSFYYVHEGTGTDQQGSAVYQHILRTAFGDDKAIFSVGGSGKIRLSIVSGKDHLGFLVYRFLDKPYTNFYLWRIGSETAAAPIIENAEYKLGPLLMNDGRILAITDRDAPNYRIVRLRLRQGQAPEFIDVIPATDLSIHNFSVTESRIVVSYIRETKTQVAIFDLFGKSLGELPIDKSDTIRLLGSSLEEDELFFEKESFTTPVQIYRYSSSSGETKLWAERIVPFNSQAFCHIQVWFTAKDQTRIPMFLVGRRDVLEDGKHPAIMTSYGGYGVPMTPQFSVFVAYLMERGCLFALPNIRGGSEFGAEWHDAARRGNRQVAFDDFICAAEWLMKVGRTEPQKLAIFGGSNSGLLVGAALTQRPDLFRAVVCMVPMLDMLRYHLFDNAHVWKEELGTADDPEDFPALLGYSPYHKVSDGTSYPATMFVSGDADQNCNPLHARKMTARLQAANVSRFPIFLDYSRERGHSPVLPLSERVEGLTHRIAFVCDQLRLIDHGGSSHAASCS